MLMPLVVMREYQTLQIKGEGVEESAYSGADKEEKARESEKVRKWMEKKWATIYIFSSFEVINFLEATDRFLDFDFRGSIT